MVNLRTYFADDIESMILSVASAILAGMSAAGHNEEYSRGVLDTIQALAFAFGISPRKIRASLKNELPAANIPAIEGNS